MQYIVLDLEFNQSFPFKTGQKTEPIAECPFEIIQIGAVKLNEQFEMVDQFNCMIHPQIYPRLHPFVEKITGIRESDLANQPLFPQAFSDFLAFIGTRDAILCTWGPDDVKSLFRNILYYNLDVDAITDQYLNIQPFAAQYLHHENGQAIGLKNAVTELNIQMDHAFHNALYDAMYTAKIFQIVHPEKIQPEIFQPLLMLAKKVKRTRIDKKALFQHFMTHLNRELSENEKKLIKMAYILGRTHTFDVVPLPKSKKEQLTKDTKKTHI